MRLDLDTLRNVDRVWAQLGITEQRLVSLAEEVSQLADAIQAVRRRIDFASEPASYRSAVAALSEGGDRD